MNGNDNENDNDITTVQRQQQLGNNRDGNENAKPSTKMTTNQMDPNDLPVSSLAWPVDSCHYKLLGKVGRGAFATVYKATANLPSPITNIRRTRSRQDTNDDPNGQANDVVHEKCTTDIHKHLCAIKVINLEHVDTNFVDIRLEVQTMRLSSHPNILACHTSFIHHTNLWLVMQLMDKGSSLGCLQTARMIYNPLNQQLNNRNQRSTSYVKQTSDIGSSHTSIRDKDKLKHDESQQPKDTSTTHNKMVINMEQHITYILHETILGLKYIHDNGQIHRDIKASNILLDSDANVRIADFGVSGWLINEGSQREMTRTFVGTPCWMAPEVMEQIHGYDTKADIWSVGITAMELAKGYAPYAKYPAMKILMLTIQEDPPSLDTYTTDEDFDPMNSGIGKIGMHEDDNAFGEKMIESQIQINEDWSDSFRSMINLCLQKDPKRRPNCEELLAHEHFACLRERIVLENHRKEMKEDICDQIRNVGDEVNHSGHKAASRPVSSGTNIDLPDKIPSKKMKRGESPKNSVEDIMMSNDETKRADNSFGLPASIDNKRPSGTSWVFTEGSQVTVSSSSHGGDNNGIRNTISSNQYHINGKDDDKDFYDHFEEATQGEDFKHPSLVGIEEKTNDDDQSIITPKEENDDEDDLNAFMDHFEKETSQREL